MMAPICTALQADMDDEDEDKAAAAVMAEALTLQKLLAEGSEENMTEEELDDIAAIALEGESEDNEGVDVEDVVSARAWVTGVIGAA